MRKIIFAISAVLISVTALAQKGIPRSNTINIGSTIITEEKVLPPYKHGFHEYVEFGTKIVSFSSNGTTGVNYIGGYRFNRNFFAGVGIGLEFAHYVEHGIREHVGANAIIYSPSYLNSADAQNPFGIEIFDREGSINLIYVPLYLQLRGYYYTGTKCSLYSSLSVGGMFAPKDSGIYADLSFGVDIKINEKNSIYLSAGFWYRRCRNIEYYSVGDYLYYGDDHAPVPSYHHYGDSCADFACPYLYEEDHYHYDVSDLFSEMTDAVGLSIRIGVPIHLIGQIFDKTKK